MIWDAPKYRLALAGLLVTIIAANVAVVKLFGARAPVHLWQVLVFLAVPLVARGGVMARLSLALLVTLGTALACELIKSSMAPMVPIASDTAFLAVESSISLGAFVVLILLVRFYFPLVSNFGLESGALPTERKHVVYTNIVSLVTASFSLVFLLAEIPLIIGPERSPTEAAVLLSLRGLLVPFLLLPLWLNLRGHTQLARHGLITVSVLLSLMMVVYYGSGAPSLTLFVGVAVIAAAVFPAKESGSMYGWLVAILMALAAAIVMRALFDPLVEITRPAVLAATEAVIIVGTFFIVGVVTIAQRGATHEAEAQVLAEQARSDSLLLNILPRPIADRLKADENARIADRFDEATVLFADLAGFTAMSRHTDPSEVVGLLDSVFREFDQLTDKYGLEKIKTIGDAYMVAGGIPVPNKEHLAAMVHIAADMQKAVARRWPTGAEGLALRVGIAHGPVVAGVIGTRKFSYDLWGDTVNLAARLESNGLPGRVQVSELVAQKLDGQFTFTPRGELDLKGIGPTPAWILA